MGRIFLEELVWYLSSCARLTLPSVRSCSTVGTILTALYRVVLQKLRDELIFSVSLKIPRSRGSNAASLMSQGGPQLLMWSTYNSTKVAEPYSTYIFKKMEFISTIKGMRMLLALSGALHSSVKATAKGRVLPLYLGYDPCSRGGFHLLSRCYH